MPLHRPYPKQAIQMLVNKHVRKEPDRFFATIDGARNKLLHGDDPEDIERELDFKWDRLSDALGKATWAALASTLVNISAASATQVEQLAIIRTNTFTHFHVASTVEISMGATHADPANPQIEEFQPGFEFNMTVTEHPRVPEQTEASQEEAPPGS